MEHSLFPSWLCLNSFNQHKLRRPALSLLKHPKLILGFYHYSLRKDQPSTHSSTTGTVGRGEILGRRCQALSCPRAEAVTSPWQPLKINEEGLPRRQKDGSTYNSAVRTEEKRGTRETGEREVGE